MIEFEELNYDTVKAHGDEIRVESQEGKEGSLSFKCLSFETGLPAGSEALIDERLHV